MKKVERIETKFEKPQMLYSNTYSLTTSKACTSRMSGKAKCGIRPNTN